MTEEENKAIENFEKRLIIEKYTKNIRTPVYIKDIETILNLIQKLQEENNNKDKIIDLMEKYIDFDRLDFKCSSLCVHEGCQEECAREYFEKQAKEV